MALARVDRPAVVLYSGPMRAGRLRRARAHDPGRVGGGRRARRAGCSTRAELDDDRARGLPGRRAPAPGNFTANTMAIALDCLGLGDRSATGSIPADARRREGRARRPGRARSPCELARRAARPRAASSTAARSRNAMAGVAASGGSTNGFLHLLAIAREAGRASSRSTSWPRSARARRCSPTSRRAGATWPRTCDRAGGTPTLIRELIRGGHVDGAAPTVDGRHARRGDGRRARARRRGASRDAVQAARRRCTRCAATSRRTGAVLKLAGTERTRTPGPARVFDDEAVVHRRGARRRDRSEGDVLVVRYEGPAGGPGMREMLERHVVGGRRRAGRVGRARHRRALLRRHARADGRATSRPRRRAAARSPRSATATW